MAKLILDAAYFIHFKHLLYFIDCSLQTEYLDFFLSVSMSLDKSDKKLLNTLM